MSQRIHLDATPGLFHQVLHCHQGDVGRQFEIAVVTRDGYEIPSGATFKIQATKPSGLGFTVTGTAANNIISFTSTEDMTSEAGEIPTQLEIKSGNDVIYTSNFLLVCETNVHPSSVTDGSPEEIISEITLLVERAESAASTAGADAAAAAQARVDEMMNYLPTEVTNLKNDINSAFGSFYFDDSVLTESGYVEENGTDAAHGSFHRSDFIPSMGATEITIVAPILANAGCVVAFYSSNTISSFISGKSCSAGNSDLTFAIPNNTKYVRFSYKTSGKFKARFNVGAYIDELPDIISDLSDLSDVIGTAFKQGETAFVRASNYQDLGLSDLLSFGSNKSYGIFVDITEDMISGLPVYGTYGTLLKFCPLGTNSFAWYMFMSFDDLKPLDMFVCCGTATTVITPWKKVTPTASTALEGKTFSIIGDSYSTFTQWNPSGNEVYFPTASETVKNVNQTWWYKLSKLAKMSLLINDSYSGATVSTHVRPAHTSAVAFVNRIKNTMGEQRVLDPKPDYIFIFGGQNDMQVGVEIGSVKYSNWTDDDLYKFAPAFCYMIDYLINWNPSATIINITNTGLTEGIATAMATACEHYGITNVVLSNIEKANMHPTATGMTSICNQVISQL